MKTITKKSTPKAANSEAQTNETPKKVSKTWQAFEKIIGTGEIVDMKAVLK
jgi:adenine deaminase